ncbi:MAG: hypothetical protein P8X78_03990 [Nitrosopumilaceae archaeon]
MEFWEAVLDGQSGGAPLSVFIGKRYQRGAGLGSLFSSLFHFILPIAKTVGAKVGRQALRTGARIAADVAEGRDIKEAAIEHAKQGVEELVQKGKGLGKRPAVKSIKGGRPVTKRRKKTKKKDAFGFYLPE